MATKRKGAMDNSDDESKSKKTKTCEDEISIFTHHFYNTQDEVPDQTEEELALWVKNEAPILACFFSLSKNLLRFLMAGYRLQKFYEFDPEDPDPLTKEDILRMASLSG